MKTIEKIWYETFPLFCVLLGSLAMKDANLIAGAFGASLLTSSLLIMRDRLVYRRKRWLISRKLAELKLARNLESGVGPITAW